MKGKYAEEYWSPKKSGHQSLKSDEMSFGCLETKHSLQILALDFKIGQSYGPVSIILSVDMYTRAFLKMLR